MEVEHLKGLSLGPPFSSIFDYLGNNAASQNLTQKAQRLHNCCNHCPSTRPIHVSESCPWALLQVHQNSESLRPIQRVETMTAWDHHWQNSRRKKQQYESISVNPLKGSVSHKIAKGSKTVSATCEETNPCRLTSVARLIGLITTHRFIFIYRKNGISLQCRAWALEKLLCLAQIWHQ